MPASENEMYLWLGFVTYLIFLEREETTLSSVKLLGRWNFLDKTLDHRFTEELVPNDQGTKISHVTFCIVFECDLM